MVSVLIGEETTALYAMEILAHGGVPFRKGTLSSLSPTETPLCLLVGTHRLSLEERACLHRFVREGGCLLGLGNPNGLDDLFGVRQEGVLREGWIRRIKNHPIGRGLKSSLHCFGGTRVTAKGPAETLAEIVGQRGDRLGDALVLHRLGKGWTLFIAPDLIGSVVHIQQGRPIRGDGEPAPDGSAPINDGILKAEDGHVLDWGRDRVSLWRRWVFFGYPIADELRILLLQSLFFLAQRKGLPLPLIWYWPKGLSGIGLISHDTDGNEPEKGQAMLGVTRGLGIETTWCILYPGGYPPSLYEAITGAGSEIALHYDAKTGEPMRVWSRKAFRVQYQWLCDMTGIRPVSNKNHYTRWEGRLEFFHWCAEVGIKADQSKGPSKRGTMGFLFGGSHPWRPLRDEGDRPFFLPVWEINLLTQDLVSDDVPLRAYFSPMVLPVRLGKWLLRETLRVGGVAHFLFHPAHIHRPGTKRALEEIVAEGSGIEWWTSERIVHWLERRRQVRQKVVWHRGKWAWELHAPSPLEGATLLVLSLGQGEGTKIYGFSFRQTIETLKGTKLIPLGPGSKGGGLP